MIAAFGERDTMSAMDTNESPMRSRRPAGYLKMLWLTALYLMDRLFDWTLERLALVRKESDLFLGLLLTILGVMSLHAGRFCDGNSADYLSCTRPAVYYYYSGIDMALVVLGVFLIAFWILARKR